MIADLILILLIFLFAFIGMKKGFMQSILSSVSFFVILIVTFLFTKKFALFLDGTFFSNFALNQTNNIVEKITSFFVSEIPTEEQIITSLSNSLPDILVKPLADAIMSFLQTSPTSSIETFLTPIIYSFIMNIISFFVLLIVLTVLLFIVKQFFKGITSLPIIKQIDRLLGFILGGVLTLLCVLIFFLILSLFSSFSWTTSIIEYINSGYIAKYLYNNNILLNILSSFINI